MSESHKVVHGFVFEDMETVDAGFSSGLRIVQVNDLNADGMEDLIVVRPIGSNDDAETVIPELPVDERIYVLESTGYGFKKAKVTSDFSDIDHSRHNNAIDLDGDELQDVVFFNHGLKSPDIGGFDAYRSHPYVLWNNGIDGYHLVKASRTSFDGHGGMAADIDGDGFGDFVALAENDVTESILVRGSANRTFTEEPLLDEISAAYRSEYVNNDGTLASIGSLTDLVGSNLPDLVIAFRTFTDAYVHIFENIDGSFTGPRYEFPMLPYDEFSQDYDVIYEYGAPKGYLVTWERILGDVDADGDDEIFFVQEAHSSAAVYGFDKQNGLPVEIGTTMFPSNLMKKVHEDGTQWQPLGFDDLNQDGFVDFVGSGNDGNGDRRRYFENTDEYHQVLLQDGQGGFIPSKTSDFLSLVKRDIGYVNAVDVNGDGVQELVGLHHVLLDEDQQTLRTGGIFSLPFKSYGVPIFWADPSVDDTANKELVQKFTAMQRDSGMADETHEEWRSYFRDGLDNDGLKTLTQAVTDVILTGANESDSVMPWPDQVVSGDYDFGNFRVVFGGDTHLNQSIQVLTAVLGEETAANYAFRGVTKQLFEQGQSMEQVCDLALDYAGLETAEEVIFELYQNLFHKEPSAEEAQPFIDLIENGTYSNAAMAAAAANLTNEIGLVDLIGLAQNGIGYI